MELQEAIEHAREVADRCESGNRECAYQHDKLADWLEELKAVKDILGDNYYLDRLRELVEADKANRCIVLPKDGMIYYIEESDGERWIGNKPIHDIIFLYGWGLASLKCSISEIGKTKHFTRESAEAALEGEQHG